MWAIVPIKTFERAKQRLANVLNEEERRSLMLAMARDVLTCLSKAKNLDGILIVSRAAEADVLASASCIFKIWTCIFNLRFKLRVSLIFALLYRRMSRPQRPLGRPDEKGAVPLAFSPLFPFPRVIDFSASQHLSISATPKVASWFSRHHMKCFGSRNRNSEV